MQTTLLRKSTIAAAAIAAAMMFGGAVSASTIQVFNDDDGQNQNQEAGDPRGSLTGFGFGVLFYAPGTLADNESGSGYGFAAVEDASATVFGELFDPTFSGSNETNEAEWVESVEGLVNDPYSGDINNTAVKTEAEDFAGGLDGKSFSTNADYVVLKIGAKPDYTILKNRSSGTFQFAWKPDGRGAGLSHFTAFGETVPDVSQIPLPAAGWLLLAGIGGLAAFRRRKSV